MARPMLSHMIECLLIVVIVIVVVIEYMAVVKDISLVVEAYVDDPSRIVSTVEALYETFGLKSVSSLPGKAKRESTRMEDFDEAAKKRLVKLTSTIMKKVCSIISAYDAEGLMKEVVINEQGVIDEGKLAENIIKSKNQILFVADMKTLLTGDTENVL
ncbi:Hypothetical predicted protein [Octopus vulgaris]|uniref:Uncharacterized protein n=1 Tax=Octopus vulgaris TaxID=6645 RepID=A0AA36AJM3_OCTVU|nr:Hypothetical predicted protein [Octopus vulgaris]